MTVLVTGATGFIGKALAESLVASGEKVRVLARRTANVATAGLIDVEVLEGDITDAEAVDRAVDGVDTVYAIAGTFREPNLTDDRYRAVNVEAVRLMMDAAKRHGVRRVVHCSTVGIHGNVVGPPASETTPLRPDGIYEITKAEGDQLALSYAGNGIETVAVRPAPVYGPGDTRLVKLYQLAGRRRVILLGDGQPRYHMIYIDDLVERIPTGSRGAGRLGRGLHHCRCRDADAGGGHPRDRPAERAPGPDLGQVACDPAPAGGRSVRVDLSPARDQPADLSPADRVLHQQPRLRHQQGPLPPGLLAQGHAATTASPARWPGTGTRACWRTEEPAMDQSPAATLLRADAGGVVRLTLNRPQAYNSLSFELLGLLQAELERIAADRSARVVVIAGAGKAFCAGHDLKEMGGDLRDAPVRALFERCSAVMTALTRLPQPVIARVHGIATAAGCQLVAACDLAVAASTSRFATSGVKYGLFCSTPMVALSRNVARKPAMEMLLTGDFVDAAEALRLGLVNRVVAEDQLDTAIDALCCPAPRQAARCARPGQGRLLPPARARPDRGLRVHDRRDRRQRTRNRLRRRPRCLRAQAETGVARRLTPSYHQRRAGVAQR